MRSAIVLLLLTATASAGNNELTLDESTRALRTSSANALTGDSLVGGGFTYARDLGMHLVPDLAIWARGSVSFGGADGTMFQTLSTEIDTVAFTAGALARYQIHRLLAASARLELGTTRAAVTISDGAGHAASDHGWGAATVAGIALDGYVFHGSRVALGVRLELAEVVTSSIPLTARPESGSEGTLQLEMTAASLGSLNLSGPSFTASFVGQF
jgi:hypothetical protein